jgi:guanylate kinase
MIALIGPSGSGKSTIEKALINNTEVKLEKIISCTTRHIRRGEKNGVDYYFLSDEEFDRYNDHGQFANVNKYHGCKYGTLKSHCGDNKVIVVVPDALEQLTKNTDLNIISFYIDTMECTRYLRMLKRGDKEKDIISRLMEDKITFFKIDEKVTHIIQNNNDTPIEEIVDKILKIAFNK